MDNAIVNELPLGIHCDAKSLYPSYTGEGLTIKHFFDHCSRELASVIQEYPENPDKYVKRFKTCVNGKIRNIVTYQASREGQQLRQLHRMLTLTLGGIYQPHQKSFAYQKGKSTIRNSLPVLP